MADLQGQQTYKLDIVFVIDATGSMTPIIEKVRERVLSLGDDIVKGMESEGKIVNQLRVRVIDFADFGQEGEDAIHSTEFFTLPDELDKFQASINGINIENRGGDIPENGLEALFIAMNSDWTRFGSDNGRHIIVVMSDASPLNLQERDGCAGYQSDLYPKDIAEMEQIWHEDDAQNAVTKLHPRKKRLVLFVPDGTIAGHSWDQLKGWENTTSTPVDAAKGLEDINYDIIIKEIVRSGCV